MRELEKITERDPEWLITAKKEIGVREIPGKENNPRIVEYHQETSLKADDDETSWCAAFVNWCLKQSGYQGTNKASAKSFLSLHAKLDRPYHGCIVVLWRNSPDSWTGHVGFYVGGDKENVFLLGGNQSNKVCIQAYDKDRVLGYFWPVIKSAQA